MNKLIKAEFYRTTHSGVYFMIFLIVGIFSIVCPFIFTEELSERNLYSYLTNFSAVSGMMLVDFMGIIMSVMLGNMYQNRTYYYEIMSGAKTHRIILSKLTVYNALSFAVVLLPAVAVFGIITAKTGTGGMETPWLTAILATVIILNITCFNVLLTMLIRHMIIGAIAIYSYSMLVTICYMIFSEGIGSKVPKIAERILNFFPQVQIFNIAQLKYSPEFIFYVIASFIVTFAVLYILVYLSYKRKKFN